MKIRFLAGLLGVLVGMTALAIPVSAMFSVADYEDCPPTAWYAEPIDFCVRASVMYGTGKGRMEPEREITRAEFVAMVTRLFRAYNLADIGKYKDVPKDAWYRDDMAKGVQMGIIKGVSDDRLDPKGHLTREQAWTILARVLALPDGDPKVLEDFYDQYEVSDWAVGPGAAMATQGRLKGYPDKSLQPKKDITRAETAQLLMTCFPSLRFGDLGSDVWKDNLLYLPDYGDEYNMKGTDVRATLVLSAGIADGQVYMRDVDIGQLVCWGAHDVWIYPGCKLDEIVVSRTDGPCIIHWLGDPKDMPDVRIPEGTNPGNEVVDKDDKPIQEPGKPGVPGTRPGRPVYVYKERAYFHWTIDGKETVETEYLHDSLVEPFEAPIWEGHVFAGWYYEPECVTKYEFGDKLEDKTDLYAKWYESTEWELIEELNRLANGSAFRVDCETDILATVGEETIPCRIRSVSENKQTVSVTLRLKNGPDVAVIDALEPGQMATEMRVVKSLDYGNFEGELVFRDAVGNELAVVKADIYAAYLWNRGEQA